MLVENKSGNSYQWKAWVEWGGNIATSDYKSQYFGEIDIKVTGLNVKTQANTDQILKYIKYRNRKGLLWKKYLWHAFIH